MKKFNLFLIFAFLFALTAGAAFAQLGTEEEGAMGDDTMQEEMGVEDETGAEQDMGMEEQPGEEPMAGMEGDKKEIKLEDVDTDGDGNVSWGELQQEAGEMITEDKYNEFDKDGDGVLGSDEFEEAKSFLKEQSGE